VEYSAAEEPGTTITYVHQSSFYIGINPFINRTYVLMANCQWHPRCSFSGPQSAT